MPLKPSPSVHGSIRSKNGGICPYYDGDDALENISGIARSTAITLERVYCFETKPALMDEEFFCAIIRAACENDWDIRQGNPLFGRTGRLAQ